MGKTKQIGQLLAEKQVKDEKKLEKRSEIKSEKIEGMKNKLAQTKKRPDKKRHLKRKDALLLKSKAIKKVDPMKAAEIKQKKKTQVKPKIDDYAAFVKAENHEYQLLRKRTIHKIKLDKELIKKAVKSLIKYHSGAKKSNDLLDGDDDFIYIEIVLSKVPEEYSIRPLQMYYLSSLQSYFYMCYWENSSLPTPIYSADHSSKFCIFTKDPQRAYKDKIKNLEIPTIARVMGYSKIDKKFPTYKDKLKLFYSYDMFFVDYQIYDLIRKPTGKIFYERKKSYTHLLFAIYYRIPFPINCNEVPAPQKEQFGEDYQAYLNDLANYTYFSMGNGPVYTIKIARTNMNIKDIVKNVIHGVYNTVPHLLKQKIKHNRVRQINLKTYNSISLPIFNQLTEEEKSAITTTE